MLDFTLDHRADVFRVVDPTPAGAPAIVHEVAASCANVLVLGETGVGKELLAETIHRLSGRTGPLLRINCAALSEQLLESELFGHERGAFTGAVACKPGLLEAARGGSVLLDEIGDLPVALQPKLLRAVESGEVTHVGGLAPIRIDVRFIAATNRDLIADVHAGRFRADLFYRLDGVSFRIPPLRERRGQIASLVQRFLDAKGRAASPAFVERALAYDWPGNVRELKAAVDRAVLLAGGRAIKAVEVDAGHFVVATPPRRQSAPRWELTPREQAERDRLVGMLESCAGNQTRAAKQMGVSRATFASKLARYRIPRPRDGG